MTTKEQELKALEQIKKIVSNLGADSYIATAFEGCFEIAEDNIENDFACSMKQRAEHYMELYENLQDEYYTLKASADEVAAAREKDVEKATEIIDKMQDRISKLNKRTPDAAHYKQIWSLVYDSIENNKAWMDTYADTMADFSDAPADIAFVNAAKNYKKCRTAYEEQKKLLDYLDTINPEA